MNAFQILIDGYSDVGCLRENNEDVIYWGSEQITNTKITKEIIVLLVADGMGGHNAGEIASSMARDHIRTVYKFWKKDPHRALIKVFTEANRKIYRTASRHKEYANMGTTCTALLIFNDCAYCAHVGDSRLYLIRDTSIYRMTEDHTIRNELQREGYIANDDVSNSALETSLITRALGISKSIKVDTWANGFPVRVKDKFLLCTDGLTDMLSDDEIKQAILNNSGRIACNKLINKAKERGGYDNISAVFAYFDKPLT